MFVKLQTIRTSTVQALRHVSSAVRSRWNWLSSAVARTFRQASLLVRSLPIRLCVALLKILQRIVVSRPFKWILTPVLYIGLIVYGLALAAGRTPGIKLPPDSPRSQEVAELIARLEASRKAPV